LSGIRIPKGTIFCPTFSYDFRDDKGCRVWGSCYKNFSSEENAREFAARELPVGKNVVRFNPKNPAFNSLELDSWYRPANLPIDRTPN
jgi:hypothetical protein